MKKQQARVELEHPRASSHVPCEIMGYDGKGFEPAVASLIKEVPLRVCVDGQELVCLMCSGMEPRFLVAGYLFSCGLIASAEDLATLEIHEDESGIKAHVRLPAGVSDSFRLHVTSGLGRQLRAKGPHLRTVLPSRAPWVSPDDMLALMHELQERSSLYRLTKGCHNAALCSAKEMLLFRSDIGRHNAVDAIVGQSLLEGLPMHDKMILTSGRAASEIVYKVVNAGVPVLAASAVATSLAVASAREQQLTLLGNVSRYGFWVYSGAERLIGLGANSQGKSVFGSRHLDS